MPDKTALRYGMDEDASLRALDAQPLPWRYCAALIALGSLGFYALGYAVFLGFARIIALM